MSNEYEAILNGPALTPPPGQSSNLSNPPNIDVLYIAIVTLCFSLASMALLIRICTKFFIFKTRGWDDYTAVLGWLLYIGYFITTGLIIHNGGGIHQWNVRMKDFKNALFYINASSIMYGITILVLKLSILLQYRQIFVPYKKTDLMYWGTHCLTALIVVFYVAMTFFEIFECNPRVKAWNPLPAPGNCWSANSLNIASGIFNVATDVLILLLPQHVIWKLNMPLKRKIAMSIIFLLGLFACVTASMRLLYAIKLANTGDVTANVMIMVFWSYAEISSCICCGSLVVAPKFFQRISQKWKPLTPYSLSKTMSSSTIDAVFCNTPSHIMPIELPVPAPAFCNDAKVSKLPKDLVPKDLVFKLPALEVIDKKLSIGYHEILKKFFGSNRSSHAINFDVIENGQDFVVGQAV